LINAAFSVKCRECPYATDLGFDRLTRMRKTGFRFFRFVFFLAITTVLCAGWLSANARADHVNVTGQGQQTPGAGTPYPANPGEGDKPSLPGDQPAKQGTDPSSQVHNTNPRDLEGNKHKEPEKAP
jgi:hypothetical protein